MVRIVLIRPGSTDFDEQGRIKGTLDIPLNDNGNGQVSQAAGEMAELAIEVVYASPCQSAEETAEVIARSLGIKAKTMDKLKNLDHGLWEGKLIDEVKTKLPRIYRRWQEHPDTVCPPEGEMLGSARQRVQDALDRILKKHKTGVIALVVPEPLASLVNSQLSNKQLGDLWKAECACGSWEMIEIEPQRMLAG